MLIFQRVFFEKKMKDLESLGGPSKILKELQRACAPPLILKSTLPSTTRESLRPILGQCGASKQETYPHIIKHHQMLSNVFKHILFNKKNGYQISSDIIRYNLNRSK